MAEQLGMFSNLIPACRPASPKLQRGEQAGVKEDNSLFFRLKTAAADIAFVDRHLITRLYEPSIIAAAFRTLYRRMPVGHGKPSFCYGMVSISWINRFDSRGRSRVYRLCSFRLKNRKTLLWNLFIVTFQKYSNETDALSSGSNPRYT